MPSRRWARWATCALAMSICVPALADRDTGARAKKSLSECTSFDQTEKTEVALDLSIKNSCTIPVDCSISWRVVCAPDSKKRRSVHPASSKLSLVEGATSSAQASAAVCGDESWSIEAIEWSCQPNKE